jgi:transcriptional regulator with XRE-family HTH domain
MTLGQTIRVLRKERKIKQKELAKAVWISQTALYNIEKDLSFPTIPTFKKICASLGHSVGYVLASTVTEDDVPPEKREVFRLLYKIIKDNLE